MDELVWQNGTCSWGFFIKKFSLYEDPPLIIGKMGTENSDCDNFGNHREDREKRSEKAAWFR